MKKPTAKGWLAIIGAIAALIITVIAALKDGTFTADEAQAVSQKTGDLIHEVQQATAEDTTL